MMRKPMGRKLRFVLVYPLVAWLLVVARTTERQLHIGIGLVALGELLRLAANGYVGHVKVNWTAASRRHPHIGSLVTAGPYAFVRHPLYLGTCLIGAGFCVMAGSWLLSSAALLLFLLVYRRKMGQEERMLRHETGAAYTYTFARSLFRSTSFFLRMSVSNKWSYWWWRRCSC